jgi:hypothetical protein
MRFYLDDNSANAIDNNDIALRQLIEQTIQEGNKLVKLPSGSIFLNEAWQLRNNDYNGLTFESQNRTRIINARTGTPYGNNCTLWMEGSVDRIGYATPIGNIDPSVQTFDVSTTDSVYFYVGTPIYLYKWDSYYSPDWTLRPSINYRAMVVHKMPIPTGGYRIYYSNLTPTFHNTNQLEYDISRCNVVQHTYGHRCDTEVYNLLSARIRVDKNTNAFPLSVGQMVKIGNGASISNNFASEDRIIVGIDNDIIHLNRPLSKVYPAASIISSDPIRNITFRGIDFDEPYNKASTPLYIHTAYNLKFESCSFGDGIQPASIVSSSNVELLKQHGGSGIIFNNCHNLLVKDGTIAQVCGEEKSNNLRIQDVTLYRQGGNTLAFMWRSGQQECKNATILDCEIIYAGHLINGFGASPIGDGGDNLTVRGLKISQTRTDLESRCYMSGANMQLANINADCGIWISHSPNSLLMNVRSPDLRLGMESPNSLSLYSPTMSVDEGWLEIAIYPQVIHRASVVTQSPKRIADPRTFHSSMVQPRMTF